MQSNHYNSSFFANSADQSELSGSSILKRSIENLLTCSLTGELMWDPVDTECWHTFDRMAIETRFGENKEMKCPHSDCDTVIKKNALRENDFVRRLCDKMREQQQINDDRKLALLIGKPEALIAALKDGSEEREAQKNRLGELEVKIWGIQRLIQEKSTVPPAVVPPSRTSEASFAGANSAASTSNDADFAMNNPSSNG